MNVVLPINYFSNDNISLLDSKQNIITDGIFTKIIFTNKLFIMNGIFLFFPLDADSMINNNGRHFINFNPNSNSNYNIIEKIHDIENDILEFYKNSKFIKKKKSFILNNQLINGNIKVYKDSNHNSSSNLSFSNKLFILKISGIWENNSEFGITYKIIIANRIPNNKY